MRARLTLSILLALFAILTLLDRFVLVELLVRRTGLPLLVAGAESLAILAVGALLRRTKRLDVPVDFLIGYPVFGTLCFLVGLLKISSWTMIPLVAVLALAGVALLLMRFAEETPEATTEPAPIHLTGFLAVMAVLACGFVAAQAPPSSLDEVAYHLAVPHTWALEGRAIELPLLSHSYFPLGIESADLPSLTLLGATGGGIASHFLHLFAAIAVALLIARRTESWLAAAAIVTTPALAITAGWSLVDWPLVGLFVVLWIALEGDDTRTASAATVAGLLVKYTFLPFAAMLWVLRRRIPSWVVVFGLVFFVRNLILTGNPIAPFFSGDEPHVIGYRALALADYVFEGSFIDESLGAALLVLAPFTAGLLPLATLAAAAALFLLAPSSRILVPFLVVPAVSAAPVLRRRVVAALVVIAVVVQTFLVVWFTGRGGAFSLLAATATEEEFLRKQRASHASVEWLNQSLPAGSRPLIVGLNETYWFAQPVRGGGNFDGVRISRYLDLPNIDAVRERLRRDGITHVAVITVPVTTKDAVKREERQTTLSPSAQKMLARMLDRYASSVLSRGNATLFTLK
jgi:hypothetical protein